jgi:predicted component of type VI protein secretion system
MSESERRIGESIDRLNDQLARLQASNARLRARLATEPPHKLYAIAARLQSEAAASGSAAGLRQAGRWEALADAIIAPG